MVVNYINSTITNSTNPVQMLQYINNSLAFQGWFGFGLDMTVFALFFFIFTFRLKSVDALVVAAFISMLAGLMFVALGLLNPNLFLVNIGLLLLGILVSLMRHVFHVFD